MYRRVCLVCEVSVTTFSKNMVYIPDERATHAYVVFDGEQVRRAFAESAATGAIERFDTKVRYHTSRRLQVNSAWSNST